MLALRARPLWHRCRRDRRSTRAWGLTRRARALGREVNAHGRLRDETPREAPPSACSRARDAYERERAKNDPRNRTLIVRETLVEHGASVRVVQRREGTMRTQDVPQGASGMSVLVGSAVVTTDLCPSGSVLVRVYIITPVIVQC
jgi:hypothetical protein